MQGYDHFFPFNIHRDNLASIKGVSFTPREIDIISCLIHVRGGRKISSLLSISPNTVLSNIRHIMLKLGCNSREDIIDFIEQSQVLPKIKEHYSHLIIHAIFGSHLKDIRREHTKKEKDPKQTLLIFQGGNLKDQKSLRLHLSTHLKQVGLRVDIQSISTNEQVNNLKPYMHRLLLCLAERVEDEIPNKLRELACVNLIEHQNYYFFIFSILKKLFPHADLTPYIQNFTMHLESIGVSLGPSTYLPQNQVNKRNKTTIFRSNHVQKYIENKKFYIFLIIFCFFLGHHIQQIFKEKKNLNKFKIYLELSTPLHVTFLQQAEDNSQVKKTELKKQILAEGHFVITGISVYLEEAQEDLGEHGGTKTKDIVNIKKKKKGSKVHASPQ